MARTESRRGRNLAPLLRSLSGALALVWKAAPGWTLAGSLIQLTLGLLPLLGFLLLRELVDSAVALAEDPSLGLRGPSLYIAAMAGLGLLIAALRAASTVVGEMQGQRLTDHVQGLIHEKSVALDLEFFENPAYYDHLHRARREGASRPGRLVARLTGLATHLVGLTAIAGLLVALSPWIVVAGLAVGVPTFLLRLRRSDQHFGWRQRRTPAERLLQLFDTILTKSPFAKELRLYRLGHLFRDRHRDLRQTVRAERLQLVTARARSELLGDAAGTVLLAGVLTYVVYSVAGGALTVGSMVMYLRVAQSALGHQQRILGAVAGLYEDGLFLSNLEAFFALEPQIQDTEASRPLLPVHLAGSIVFDRVSFAYPGTKRLVLDNLQLELRTGEVTAIVGSNGSGKTTLVKLLCRLYDPDQGRILVGGADIRSFRVDDLRSSVSVLFQDFLRFPATVSENIGFGDVERLEQRDAIVEAADWASLGEQVKALPERYDTLLGRWFESGQELSRGQWQRLALARARFRDAPIIVLDEPTSSLDALAEEQLLTRLLQLVEGRTTLLISHRFSTVRAADRIAVMEGGRIAEFGSHDALVERGNLYARMYAAQARRYA